MATWEPTSTLAKAVVAAGFRYDPVQDIIYSKHDAWQRQVGFTWAYDVASAPLHMIIDCETFYFWYGNKPWLIELWKGQYGLETGAEIGVYFDNLGGELSIDPKSRFYGSVKELRIKFTLYRKGTKLLHRDDRHWWLTGFKWGVFTEKTRDLIMDLEIEFPDTEMRDAFNQAVIKRGYPNSAKGNLSVAFTFAGPKTPQPPTRLTLESRIQSDNQRLVEGYNLLKLAKTISTNDPNAFTALDEQAQKSVQVFSAAAAKVHSNASAVAKKLQSNASPLATTFKSKVTPVAKNVYGKAAGAVDTLQSMPDEARTAYDKIFAFFDKKVWHVTRRP
jgi:hypothetical protein